jgi:hypothetical protein
VAVTGSKNGSISVEGLLTCSDIDNSIRRVFKRCCVLFY